jgi:hypothetical protein
MLKYITLFLVVLFNVIFNPMAMATTSYAQLASNQDQTVDAINKDIVVQLQNVDVIESMDWNKDENKLIVKEDGLYFIMAVAQVGARESGAKVPDTGGDLYLWFAKNNVPINNSSNWIHVSPQSKSNTIVDQYALPLSKGDSLQFMFSTNTTSVGLVAFRGTEQRPNSPGLTVSVFKLGEIPAK